MQLAAGRRMAVALLSVAVLAAACGSTAVDDETTTDVGEPSTVDPDALSGSSWTLRFGGGPDGDIALVDGWPITLTFDDGTFGGTAACNGYGGAFTIEGSQLRLDQLAWNEMGCEPEIQASEQAYLAALGDVDGIDLIGDELALSGPSTELIFGRTDPAPVGELVDTLWLLDATVRGGVVSPVEGEPATLLLGPDGSVTGGTGCRSLSGHYIVSGNQILFNELAADGDCPAALAEQDGIVVAVLGDGFVPEVDGDTLLLTSQGDEGLRYRAAEQ